MRYQKHGLQLSGDHDRRTTWLRLSFWRVLVQFSWDHQPMWGDPISYLSIRVGGFLFKLQVTDDHAEVNLCAKI